MDFFAAIVDSFQQFTTFAKGKSSFIVWLCSEYASDRICNVMLPQPPKCYSSIQHRDSLKGFQNVKNS